MPALSHRLFPPSSQTRPNTLSRSNPLRHPKQRQKNATSQPKRPLSEPDALPSPFSTHAGGCSGGASHE
ncbi:uncharacterized protein THITE_2124686 [Thermothielavioides terrestris NRRL 8126]|uniref:Uncharacterized protein n=1 Tax=Thermothielavioides terrestris (strain ATCC 38088 / NRRL 8126) TaxID=578455 RepID=G2RG95_THETT|nr:uncharacterized protein THITE_2124686 [Thermothielavioides terrestris NRRL 8126]AEO71838.1 hypothetical protein THITE_2124686 [Thermothielavioides terrestris NRRL 8126]